MQELPRYDGKEGRELWRKKVTYYLHSRNPDMASLLRWAELQKDTITPDGLRQARANDPSLAGLQEDPEVLSYHLWGFLQREPHWRGVDEVRRYGDRERPRGVEVRE